VHMLFGVFIGLCIVLFSPNPQETQLALFDPEIFFFLLLPPIIFDSGFSLSKKHFFRNFGSIMLFAVFGTVVSSLLIGFGIFGLARVGLVPIDADDPLESLLFGALISAVDPVGTLAVLGKKEFNADPMLYSLIFGESVLNDAVSIVLYKTLDGFSDRDIMHSFENHFFEFVGVFFGVFVGSLLVGVAVALLCAIILKNNDMHEEVYLEFTVILLFSYGSYSVAEILEMSGIVSVFACGVVMSHYALHNVTAVCKISVHSVIKAIAHLCETFLYAYLGITAGLSFQHDNDASEWSFNLIFFSILLCMVTRAMHIFPFSALANLRRVRPIPFNMQVMMWFSGIRGAICFALALNLRHHHRHVIITTTLTIVFFTTLVGGGLTERMLAKLNLKNSTTSGKPEEPDTFSGSSREKMDEFALIRTSPNVLWKQFDHQYMNEWFGGSRNLVHAKKSTPKGPPEQELRDVEVG